LEYGCGMGSKVFKLSSLGANCSGIDISDYAIQQAIKKSENENLSITLKVMNAENLEFGDNKFDMIFGTAILHHLDLEKAYKTISKSLKPAGFAVFIEPLGHNVLINRFRDKTPELRTEDEHPLLMKDIELAKEFFNKIELRHYYLSTLILPVVFKNRIPKFLLKIFDSLDSILFSFPFMKRLSWQILVKLEEPKKD
jgi:SAM-dependent methyltransferase